MSYAGFQMTQVTEGTLAFVAIEHYAAIKLVHWFSLPPDTGGIAAGAIVAGTFMPIRNFASGQINRLANRWIAALEFKSAAIVLPHFCGLTPLLWPRSKYSKRMSRNRLLTKQGVFQLRGWLIDFGSLSPLSPAPVQTQKLSIKLLGVNKATDIFHVNRLVEVDHKSLGLRGKQLWIHKNQLLRESGWHLCACVLGPCSSRPSKSRDPHSAPEASSRLLRRTRLEWKSRRLLSRLEFPLLVTLLWIVELHPKLRRESLRPPTVFALRLPLCLPSIENREIARFESRSLHQLSLLLLPRRATLKVIPTVSD